MGDYGTTGTGGAYGTHAGSGAGHTTGILGGEHRPGHEHGTLGGMLHRSGSSSSSSVSNFFKIYFFTYSLLSLYSRNDSFRSV